MNRMDKTAKVIHKTNPRKVSKPKIDQKKFKQNLILYMSFAYPTRDKIEPKIEIKINTP